MTAQRHVFIVGLPRTGTTLTRAILNTSPEAGIGGESKFLPNPAERGRASRRGYGDILRQAGDLGADEGISEIAATIYERSRGGYWSNLARGLDRAEFERRLRASDRSERALFSIAMDHFAGGRPVRGDKSPQHLHWVPQLLQWFPEARVIHTFRDPRAIHVSLQQKSRRRGTAERTGVEARVPALGLYSATSLIRRWRRAIALHHDYQRRYPDQYLLVRFEDLVGEPRSTIERLCSHVGVAFTDEMLNQVVRNSSFVADGTADGFDATAVERWRRHMSPLTRRWFDALCGRELRAFGYAP